MASLDGGAWQACGSFFLPVNGLPRLDAAVLLKEHHLRPNPRLGQNFLQDPAALKGIVAAADIQAADSVLEIGCGFGNLTRYLAMAAQRVIAVELDPRLARVATEVLEPYGNVRIFSADILALSPKDLGLDADYLVTANIPYNITSAIIRHLLESQPKPRRIVLTVQKEVAERICSEPPRMSILALSIQVFGSARIVARIPAAAFLPKPKVDSAVVRIEIHDAPRIPSERLAAFFILVKAGFGQRRKTLRNNFASGLRLGAARAQELITLAGIDPRLRAEALGFPEWDALCHTPSLLHALGPAKAGR